MIEIRNSVVRHISFIVHINVTTIDVVNHARHVHILLGVVLVVVRVWSTATVLFQPLHVVRVTRHVPSTTVGLLLLFLLNWRIGVNLLQMTVQLHRIVVDLRSLSSILSLIIHHLSRSIGGRRKSTMRWH